MLGWLYSIFNAIIAFWSIITTVLGLISKYGVQWLTLITHTVGVCYNYIPFGLMTVASVCIATMIVRLLFNLIRGSGA